jgi:RNA-directed DNA polymerase
MHSSFVPLRIFLSYGRDEIVKNPLAHRLGIAIPTLKDRVVQTALLIALEPLFEPGFAERSYGFRRGKSCHGALRQVMALLDAGYSHVVDADIWKFFDSINHTTLLNLLCQKVKEEQILRLIRAFLLAGILEGDTIVEPGLGTPQGGPISPLLANITLDPLDHMMAQQGYQMVRFADDFLVLCRTRQHAKESLGLVKEWLNTVGLSLHPDKVRITKVGTEEGFDFLGYRFLDSARLPRPENIDRLKEKMAKAAGDFSSRNLDMVVQKIDQITTGWFQHFALSNYVQPFQELDHWVWKCLTDIQWSRIGRNRQSYIKPLTKAPFSLTRALVKKLRDRN